ncbi:MAG: DUF2855 family protein [Sphingomonas sp.]|uniref:DUF2855 family protein n=1 Tax=Sphingomonas sp. TaxID=28214 RepID=UPI0025F54F90|nr:DUF2855 family protein [Sphingomonas sp.]MBY0282534.1 DUF2855 family protein [Sphingomonas sp.]
MTTKLIVNRAQIDQAKIVERDSAPLEDGQIRIATRRFALTANNISYALSGEAIGYWRFFPDAEDGWGCVPVWGFGDVVESRAEGIAVGDCYWGFFPMASELVMAPSKISANGITDGIAHRRELPYVYNMYARTNDDPAPLAAIPDLRSLMFPLLTTSYVIDDYIADNAGFGAAQVMIGSASSKTAFGLAHYLRQRGEQQVIGLTSPRNIAFVEGLGLYDRVLAYDAINTLDPATASVFVDMSGDGAVVASVHQHFGDQVKASIGVGATHWGAGRAPKGLPGARPAFFFAPAQIAKRDQDWGAGVLMRRAVEANIAACAVLSARMAVIEAEGADAIAAAYAEMVAGKTPPDRGLILAF